MEKLKKAIILICILILIIVISIFLINYNEKNSNETTLGDEGEVFDFENQHIEDVTDKVKFFTVSNCISRYFDQINKENVRYYGVNEYGEYTINVSQEEINQDNYDLLSQEYIQKNKIKLENVEQYIDVINEKVIYTPLKMKVLIASNVDKYVTYGFIQDTQNEFIKEVYLIVNLDTMKKTFSIEPLYGDYNSIDDIHIENENVEIETNENNTYTDAKINYEYVAKEYFNTYKRMCLSNPEMAYKYLQDEYKTKRFSDVNLYKQYVEKNKQELTGITINQYMVNNYEDYTEFVCKDQNGNLYIFREKDINNFVILLDTYTITTDKFKQEYEKADVQNKVMMNVDKWFQMLNNRDYTSAYNMLDETFRNNNFNGDLNAFEEYMRNKYPLHYEVSYIRFQEQPGDVYSQEILLNEFGVENEIQLNFNIVMKLKEGTDFVMSFEV